MKRAPAPLISSANAIVQRTPCGILNQVIALEARCVLLCFCDTRERKSVKSVVPDLPCSVDQSVRHFISPMIQVAEDIVTRRSGAMGEELGLKPKSGPDDVRIDI
jgi:hypothetical protein